MISKSRVLSNLIASIKYAERRINEAEDYKVKEMYQREYSLLLDIVHMATDNSSLQTTKKEIDLEL